MITAPAVQMPRSWHDGGMFIGMHWAWWGFWILTAFVLGWALRRAVAARPDTDRQVPREEDAEAELRARYARGEIDDDEFARRLEVLRETHGSP